MASGPHPIQSSYLEVYEANFFSFIAFMIIPGKKMIRNDINFYLQPLIKELKKL